jgi:hypothetical protein
VYCSPSTPCSAPAAPKGRGRPKKAPEAAVKVTSSRQPVGLRSTYADGEASSHASKKNTVGAMVETLSALARQMAPTAAAAAGAPLDPYNICVQATAAYDNFISSGHAFHKIRAVELASKVQDSPYFEGLAEELRSAVEVDQVAASETGSGAASGESESGSESDPPAAAQ